MFWETILGNELAHTLIEELPRITEPKKQETVLVLNAERAIEEVQKQIAAGKRYVNHIQSEIGILLIFES